MSRSPAFAVLLMLLFGGTEASATPLFFDNFNSGPSPAWGDERGNWTTLSGQYYAQAPNNTPPTYSDVTTLPSLTDFAIDVDVNNFVDGGIWLRSNYNGGNESGVLLVTGGFSHTGGGLYWHVVHNGVFSGIEDATSDLGLRGTDVHLHVVVSGDTYEAFVNGATAPAATLTDTSLTSGHAGLYDFTANQYFDNFEISSLDSVPAPGSLLLVGTGLLAGARLGRRYRRTTGSPIHHGM